MSYCKDKVAVVTGAGGTLCSAIAVDLAKKGAKVVLVGRTRDKLEKVADEIAVSGGICRIEPADVTDEAAVRIGKVTVRPDDIIMGDIDGVICIPREIAYDVLLRAEGIERNEVDIFSWVHQGDTISEIIDKGGYF